jgi:hypothetical protein
MTATDVTNSTEQIHFQQDEVAMKDIEEAIGDYVVGAKALYVSETDKWQPVLRITRCRGAPDVPIHQDFTQLSALSESEADAIRYGLQRGRALVEGNIIGLTI